MRNTKATRSQGSTRPTALRHGLALVLAVLLLCAIPSMSAQAANLFSNDATGYGYWNDKTYALRLVDAGTLQVTEGGKSRTLSLYEKNVTSFFVSGTRVVYYARNKSGKLKWFVSDLKTKKDTEYAHDTLSPFWCDADGVYTTSAGKRTYDYLVYRFDTKTGKKTKLADVYGMPVGYVSGKLVAMDFYHKEVRLYKGSTLNQSVSLPGLTDGFVCGGAIYARDSGYLYRIKDGKAVQVLEASVMKMMRINDAMLIGTLSDNGYPTTLYLVTASKVEELGSANDAAELAKIAEKAVGKAKK